MRNMKSIVMILMALLLWLAAPGYAAATEPALSPQESCEHVWSMMRTTESNLLGQDVVVVTRTRELVVNLGDHHTVFDYVMCECMLCGVQQEIPTQINQPHHYQVAQWEQDETNADAVHVTYNCSECGQLRKEVLSIAVIQGAEGAPAAVNCRHGAACPEKMPYEAAENWYFIMPDGGHYNMVRVLLDEDGQQVTRLAARQHCKFCGRPQMCLIDIEVAPEVYISLPEFTYEQFMTYDADLQAPYQLIDTLRTTTPAS